VVAVTVAASGGPQSIEIRVFPRRIVSPDAVAVAFVP
jgi:hypothetical protein